MSMSICVVECLSYHVLFMIIMIKYLPLESNKLFTTVEMKLHVESNDEPLRQA